MAVQVGLNDIVAVVKVALWINDYMLTPEQEAPRRYNELRAGIQSFAKTLSQYHDLLLGWPPQSFAQQDESLSLPDDANSDYQLDIKRYRKTLEAAKRFVIKYANLGQQSTLFSNLVWHTRAETQANELRTQIQEHRREIGNNLQMLTLKLTYCFTRILPDTSEPLGQQEQLTILTETIDSLLQRLNSRFSSLMHNEASISTARKLRFVYDAIATSMQQSGQISHECCLKLLQAQWLLRKIRERDDSTLGPEQRQLVTSLSLVRVPRRLAALDPLSLTLDDLFVSFDRNPLSFWHISNDTLLRHNGTNSTTQLEEPLVMINLPGDSLQVSRIGCDTLRISPSQTVYFNVKRDSLVPWYAISHEPQLMIYSSLSARSEMFELETRANVLKVQSALLEYQVCAPDQIWKDVCCTIARRGRFGVTHVSFSAQLQLWMWPVAAPSAADRSDTLSPHSTTSGSIMTSNTVTTIIGDLHSSTYRFYPSSDGRNGVIEAELPPPPLLILFSRRNDVYTMWRLDLCTAEISERPESAPKLVLRKAGGRKLDVRALNAQESDLSSWNLCDMLASQLDQKCQHRVEKIDTRYVAFTFADIETRDSFLRPLHKLQVVRSTLEASLRNGERKARIGHSRINISSTSRG